MNDDLSKYSDRDLLISLHTKVGIVATSVADHETRIRVQEKNSQELNGSITGLKFAGGITSFVMAVCVFLGWRNS